MNIIVRRNNIETPKISTFIISKQSKTIGALIYMNIRMNIASQHMQILDNPGAIEQKSGTFTNTLCA